MPRDVAVGTVLVGPNALLREGLARILRPPRFKIIASGSIVDLSHTAELERYAVRLLVIESAETAIAARDSIACFKHQHPLGRVAVVGAQWCASDILAAFQAGANVYVSHVTSGDEFVKTIELVLLGQTLLPSELLPQIAACRSQPDSPPRIAHHPEAAANNRLRGLSSREQNILSSVARGGSNKQIAREFEISEATVKVHMKTILRKLGVANRTQAAIWAMTNRSGRECNPIEPVEVALH
jgi:two-component system nitrate/nitrite response regulator NarL